VCEFLIADGYPKGEWGLLNVRRTLLRHLVSAPLLLSTFDRSTLVGVHGAVKRAVGDGNLCIERRDTCLKQLTPMTTCVWMEDAQRLRC
jgi:hypothetical protein